MKELLPKLVPLKGDFDIHRSLVDCFYQPDDPATGGPTIRFSLGIANAGEGPLHLILHNIREENNKTIASARQRIYKDDRTYREVDVDDFERTTHDVHDAWHYPRLASFGLIKENGEPVVHGKKAYYCMVDIFRLPDSMLNSLGLVNSPNEPKFKFEVGCLPKTEGEVGISIGWADNYGSHVSDQYIDISNVQTGTYMLELRVNKTRLVTASTSVPTEQLQIRINKEEHKVEKI